VCVLTEPCLNEAVRAIGAEFKEFRGHFTRTDRTVDLIQDSKAKPLAMPVLDNVLIGPAMGVAEETRAALRETQTDVVVADFMMVGGLVAAEAMAIKRVALVHQPEYLPGPGRPPAGMGLLPATSAAGRLRDRLLTRLFHRMLDRYLPALNTVREAFALPRLGSLADVYHQANLRLIQTSKAFDAPLVPAPANVRYVGPVLDDPAWAALEQDLWPESDSRPLVVVSLSTTFQNQRSILDSVIGAVSGMEVCCLITLGPAMSKEKFHVPENVIALPGVAHNQVFPRADAVVTHAGHGTVMRALAHGLPLVCLPMGRDQVDNAALVVRHGAGLKLSPKAKSGRIAAAIGRVLSKPDFAMNARFLQKSILADAKADLAVTHLEQLATGKG